MESIFKEKLLSLRRGVSPKTFAESLFPRASWARRAPKREVVPENLPEDSFTEKVQVIESFERFAQERTKELKTNILEVPGGEIHLKSQDWEGIESFPDKDSLLNSLTLSKELLGLSLKNKNPHEVEVIFVTE